MSSKYDRRVDVYFHEANDRGWYHVSFDDELAPDALYEPVEGQLGSEYERLVGPGEGVYVGYIKFRKDGKYDQDRFSELDDWAFNRIPPEYVDAEPDELTYEQEGGVDGYRVDSPVDIVETARDLNVETSALFGVVDNYERRNNINRSSGPKIETIHAYWNAIGVVELTENLEHTHGGYVPYALVDFNGYVFPFHPKDLQYVAELYADADLE